MLSRTWVCQVTPLRVSTEGMSFVIWSLVGQSVLVDVVVQVANGAAASRVTPR